MPVEGAPFILCGIVIILDAIACGEFVILQRGKPFGANALVGILQCGRKRADAGEYRPSERRYRPKLESFGHLVAFGVEICDEILELFAAHRLVDVDAVASFYDGTFAALKVLLPEFRDLRFRLFVGKGFRVPDDGKRRFGCDLLVHEISSFERKFDFQRCEGFEEGAVFERGGGRDTVEARERFRKTVGRIVPVLQRDVDHLVIGTCEIVSRECQTSHADILRNREAAEHRKSPLKIERGNACLLRDALGTERLIRDVLLDVPESACNDSHPIHTFRLLPL